MCSCFCSHPFYAIYCYSLADHFGGKLHMGFVQIRDKIAILEVKACDLSLFLALGVIILYPVHLQ